MKHSILRNAGTAAVLVIAAAAAWAQGVYWESTMTGTGMEPKASKMYYMPRMFKHVDVSTGEAMIVRLDKQMMYRVDPKDKTYSEITFADMEAKMKKAGATMDAKMEEMQKRLASLPPEQRKMIEDRMGGLAMGNMKDAKFDVTKTGEKKEVSGYGCTKYDVTRDGKEFMTMWVTKDVHDFDAMRKDFEEYGKMMSAMNEMMGKGMIAAMQKIDGFPMQTEISGMTTVVTKVERQSTPVSEFDVPAGYTKMKSTMFDTPDEK